MILLWVKILILHILHPYPLPMEPGTVQIYFIFWEKQV